MTLALGYNYHYIFQFGHSCFVLELVAGSDNHSDAHSIQPSDFQHRPILSTAESNHVMHHSLLS